MAGRMPESDETQSAIRRLVSATNGSPDGVRWEDLSTAQKRLGIAVSILVLTHLSITSVVFMSAIGDKYATPSKRNPVYDAAVASSSSSNKGEPSATTSTSVVPTTLAPTTTYKPRPSVPPKTSYGSDYSAADNYGYSNEDVDGYSYVYYHNCSAARAAGAAPVYSYDPGYGSHLDRDSDGIGCE